MKRESNVYRKYLPHLNICKVSNFFLFLLTEAKMIHLSTYTCKNAQETYNWDIAWRKLMRLLVVSVTNDKSMDVLVFSSDLDETCKGQKVVFAEGATAVRRKKKNIKPKKLEEASEKNYNWLWLICYKLKFSCTLMDLLTLFIESISF